MIAGRAMTGDMEGTTGYIRIHDGCAFFCYHFYQRTYRKFVATYRTSEEDHHIIGFKSHFFSSSFDMQIYKFLCDAFGFDDGSTDKTDFTVELFRRLNRLVQTGHIGRIGSDKFLSLIVTHRFFKILREHLFRRSKSGPFSAKAIRKKGRNAFLCCLCYFEKFRPFLVSRSQIEFVVRSMVEVAYRCFNEKVCRIWYGVCDMDKGNVEITDLHGARSKLNRLDNMLR